MPTRPTSGYDNEEIPDSMPLQNQGAIPVLVRLVDGELGQHFRPAEARRLDAGVPVRLVRRHFDAERNVGNALQSLDSADYLAAQGHDVQHLRDTNSHLLTTGLQQLRQVRAEMRGRGMPPPQPAPIEFIEALAARDVTWED
jgi:hypothetical protein